jgi:hypothetical protein
MNLAVPFAGFAALLPSRKTWAHTVRVTAICAIFAVLLAAGFQHRRDLADMLRTTFAKSHSKSLGNRVNAARSGEVQVLRPLDPASGFAETPIGVMLHASSDAETCRRVLFDNRTGLAYDDGHGHCGLQPTPPAEHLGMERIQAMSRAFRR